MITVMTVMQPGETLLCQNSCVGGAWKQSYGIFFLNVRYYMDHRIYNKFYPFPAALPIQAVIVPVKLAEFKIKN